MLDTHYQFALPISLLIIANLLGNEGIDNLNALWNLEAVCECQLNHTAIEYDNYGCWCGIGGSGEPMDGIDRCCMHHDQCYDKAIIESICTNVITEYITSYKWKCEDHTPVCLESGVSCRNELCECDRRLVECWSYFERPKIKPNCVSSKTKRRHGKYSYDIVNY